MARDADVPSIRKGSLRYRVVAAGGLALIHGFEAIVRRVAGNAVFYEPADFPWTADLERKWRDAREELCGLLADESAVPGFEEISEEQARIVRPRTWKAFMFYTFGCRVPANCARCPKTAALLESIPGMTLGMFSILTPHSRIAPHRGVYNGVLRYHLALVVPSSPAQCGLRIGGETRGWREGESLIFDDTHEHEAWNDSDENRVVLFVDFLRELPSPLSWLNRALLALIRRSPYVQNMVFNLAELENRAG
jgi:beta-hydroxylase